MTNKKLKEQIRKLSHIGLSVIYEFVCEEYRNRLIKLWDLDEEQVWWIPSNRIGETISVNDCELSFGIEDLRLIVDNNITYESYSEYSDYVIKCYDEGVSPINSKNWLIRGIRPSDINLSSLCSQN